MLQNKFGAKVIVKNSIVIEVFKDSRIFLQIDIECGVFLIKTILTTFKNKKIRRPSSYLKLVSINYLNLSNYFRISGCVKTIFSTSNYLYYYVEEITYVYQTIRM